MYSSRSVTCAISSYVVIFLVILGTLSKMALAAPPEAGVPSSSSKSTRTSNHADRLTSLVFSALIKAASRLCQWMPQLMKPSSQRLKLSKKLERPIFDDDSSFENFD